jgi:hypothetical protein
MPLVAQSAEPALPERPPAEGAAVRVETSLVSTPVSA